jgi:hypothetical protein
MDVGEDNQEAFGPEGGIETLRSRGPSLGSMSALDINGVLWMVWAESRRTAEERYNVISYHVLVSRSHASSFWDQHGRSLLMGEMKLVRRVLEDAVEIYLKGMRPPRKDRRDNRSAIEWQIERDWIARDEPDVAYSFTWCVDFLSQLSGLGMDAGKLREALLRLEHSNERPKTGRRARIRSGQRDDGMVLP